jgi:hypothetical protein
MKSDLKDHLADDKTVQFVSLNIAMSMQRIVELWKNTRGIYTTKPVNI